MKLQVKKIIEICEGTLLCGNEELIISSFSKDTRTIQKNDCYVGIKGESFDGNAFYEEAFQKGASACLLDSFEGALQDEDERVIILVKDTVIALQKLAAYVRSQLNIPVIAVTGSVGKTTTKDLIASLLSQKYKVLKSPGNLNGQIGLPLNILKYQDEDVLVLEMGMNDFGQIETLSKIAQPTIAVITNIGTAHLGILGSRENILKAKMEILEGLKPEGTVVINQDNDLLRAWYEKNKNQYKVITYGIKQESNYTAKEIQFYEDRSEYWLYKKEKKIRKIVVPIGGSHFVQNSLCAIAVGELFHIPIEKIEKGILSFELTKKRMDITTTEDGVTIINDCYNANLDSMTAALEYLGKIKDKRRIAVLGDMLELGEYAEELHRKVGEIVVRQEIDKLITVGKEAQYIAQEAERKGMKKENINICKDNKEAVALVKTMKKREDVILFKASNGMHFDEIIHSL